jgi:acyl-CoA synthetase (NDP forming)/RimJ/RimL family protein N-acetyltransferase
MSVPAPARPVAVALRDGSTVTVRPVVPEDRDRLLALLEGLDPEARRLRFFSAGASMAWAADQMVAGDTGSYGLVALQGADGDIVGHAEYFREGRTDSAEVAFEIANALQGMGLGTILLGHLATQAVQEGIEQFTAEVMPENHRMIGVFRESGFEPEVRATAGALHVAFPTELTEDARRRFERRDSVAAAAAVRHVLEPDGIAVLGASAERGAMGAEVLRNLVRAGYRGEIFPVTDQGERLLGLRAYPTLLDVPAPVELAVVAVPKDEIIDAARACATKGVRALVILSSGFGHEPKKVGSARRRELLAICRQAGMRLVGPNCLGVANPARDVRLDATFAPGVKPAGTVGLLSQSGGLGVAVMERLRSAGLGISSFVSAGDKADMSGNDLLQYWENDDSTEVVLLYLESFGNPRNFARIARRVAKCKPVIAVKAGAGSAGRRATGSSTGALLATSDITVGALFRQAGVIRTDTLAELLDVTELLASQPLPAGPRVAFVTTNAGPGRLAADAAQAAGLEVPELTAETQETLLGTVTVASRVDNPVDMGPDVKGEDFARALRAVAADPGVDAVVAIIVPPLVAAETAGPARALAGVQESHEFAKPLLGVYLGGDPQGFDGFPPPLYAFPEEAVRALSEAVRYAAWKRSPSGSVVEIVDARRDEAAAIIADALAAGPGWMEEPALDALLDCYGLGRLPVHIAADPAEAGRAAVATGGPVVLKAVAPGLRHKTEAGAVALHLRGWEAVEEAAAEMSERVKAHGYEQPTFRVQAMAPDGVELMVGVAHDPHFGPIVVCGAGGTAVEVLNDVAVRLTPLTDHAIDDMLRSLRTWRLLEGYRGAPRADIAALEDVLARVSAMVEAHPEISELDLNPIIAAPDGAYVVDGRVRVEPRAAEMPLRVLRA